MKSLVKFVSLILFGLAVTAIQADAQFFLGKKKAKLTGFRLNLGGNADIYPNLSGEGLYSMLKPNQSAGIDIRQYRENPTYGGYAAEMTGGYLGFDLTFSPRALDGTVREDRELRIGLDLNLEREILIDMSPLSNQGNWLGLCVIENSFNLNFAYLFKTDIANIIEFYAGPGANFGGSFGNDFIFMGSGDNTFYDAYDANFLRAYGLAGFGLNFWNVKFQMEGSYGLGSQIVHNGDVNILRTYGIELSVGYKF